MTSRALQGWKWSSLVALFVCLPLAACGSGSDGTPGASTGTLAGIVSNSMTSAGLGGVTVTITPAPAGGNPVTDGTGAFSVRAPLGTYSVAVQVPNYTDVDTSAGVYAAQTTTLNLAMIPTSPVAADITGAPASPAPGDSFAPTITPMPMDGSTVTSYLWTQIAGPAAIISGATTANPTITLADEAAFKAALLTHLEVLDRFVVQGISPFSLEEGGLVTLMCTVTTTGPAGTYDFTMDMHVNLPCATWSPGLRNVPIGSPVLLTGKDQASWDWTVTVAPGGSTAILNDATTRHPWFVPDVAGMYTINVTDIGAAAGFDLEIYAGSWVGAISGIAPDGFPATASCNGCHDGAFGPKVQFDLWRESGHAHIFETQINTSGHYGSGCFACHTVGYYTGVTGDGGFEEATDYAGFLAGMFPGGHGHADPSNYATIVSTWPATAQLATANIQCENCHGPNHQVAHLGSVAHDSRISLSSDVCGICHGEPPRHARFQQWEGSGHGNYEVAIEEGTRSSCAQCHTANGFLDWLEDGTVDVTPTADTIHPITCVVCHDPHDVGTVSGGNNNIEVRIDGDAVALAAGYDAPALGHGAICITCHNSRRGEANDDVGLPNPSRPDYAPHGGAQGDMVMGQNAFFVTTGIRGAHSYIENSCTNCHMVLTPPPAELSYNLGGTNHTFEADVEICSECHGAFDGENLAEVFEAALHDMEMEIARAIAAEIQFHLDAGRSVTVTGVAVDEVTPVVAVITPTSVFSVTHLGESHGRQAMDLLVDGVHVGHVRLSADTALSTSGTLVVNTEAGNLGLDLAKCGWNFFMLHNDGSHGIHNPGFAGEIVAATLNVIEMNWPTP